MQATDASGLAVDSEASAILMSSKDHRQRDEHDGEQHQHQSIAGVVHGSDYAEDQGHQDNECQPLPPRDSMPPTHPRTLRHRTA